jgi:hypothetical protein
MSEQRITPTPLSSKLTEKHISSSSESITIGTCDGSSLHAVTNPNDDLYEQPCPLECPNHKVCPLSFRGPVIVFKWSDICLAFPMPFWMDPSTPAYSTFCSVFTLPPCLLYGFWFCSCSRLCCAHFGDGQDVRRLTLWLTRYAVTPDLASQAFRLAELPDLSPLVLLVLASRRSCKQGW